MLWTVSWVEMSLAALRGDLVEADRRRDHVLALAREVALPVGDIPPVIVDTIRHVWEPRPADAAVAELIVAQDLVHPGPGAGLGHGLLARVGDPTVLRRSMSEHSPTETLETWATPMLACFEVEAASVVGDAAVARRWSRVLEPLEGRMALAGVSLVFGPVDGYLALASATLGDREAAGRQADRALVLADEWSLPAYRGWLLAQRSRLGF